MEFSEERHLKLASGVIATLVAFEYFVETLEEERPEFMEGPIVAYRIGCVAGVVVVWSNHRQAVKLFNNLSEALKQTPNGLL
jgi:hypothetical protein